MYIYIFSWVNLGTQRDVLSIQSSFFFCACSLCYAQESGQSHHHERREEKHNKHTGRMMMRCTLIPLTTSSEKKSFFILLYGCIYTFRAISFEKYVSKTIFSFVINVKKEMKFREKGSRTRWYFSCWRDTNINVPTYILHYKKYL